MSGAVLQAAATAMDSDTRIMDDPSHNSYVLDDITERVTAASLHLKIDLTPLCGADPQDRVTLEFGAVGGIGH